MAKQLSSFQPQGTRATTLADTSLFSDANLVSYWKLDESSGNASDSIGSNTLINNNTVAYSQGVFGNSADTGSGNTNKWMNVASNLGITTDGTGNATLSCWARYSSFAAGDVDMTMLLSRLNQRRWWIGPHDGGTKLRFFVVGSSPAGYDKTFSFATNTWYHIAITVSGATVTFYVNGVSLGTDTIGLLGTATNFDSFSLFRESGDSKYASGKIDDVAVFSRALSPSEIQTLYYAGSTKLYMPLNGSSVDISGNGNHGTDTAVTYVQGKFGQGARFNGSSKIQTESNLGISTGSWTMSAFIKPNTLPSVDTGSGSYDSNCKTVVCKNDAGTNVILYLYLMRVAGVQKIAVNRQKQNTANANVEYSYTCLSNTWTHLTGTYDGTTLRLFLNGLEVGTPLATSGTGASGGFNKTAIGAYTENQSYFDGIIDEVIIENRAWTPQEISLYYRKSMLNYKQRSLFNLIKDFVMTGDTAVFTITGYNASLTLIQRLVADTANFIITGYDAIIRITGAWRNPDNKSSSTYTNPDNKSSTNWTNRNKNS